MDEKKRAGLTAFEEIEMAIPMVRCSLNQFLWTGVNGDKEKSLVKDSQFGVGSQFDSNILVLERTRGNQLGAAERRQLGGGNARRQRLSCNRKWHFQRNRSRKINPPPPPPKKKQSSNQRSTPRQAAIVTVGE